MNKLGRYLVILAGLALAMLMTVPAAAAYEKAGPTSHACKEAKHAVVKVVVKIKADILIFLGEPAAQAPAAQAPAARAASAVEEKEWFKEEWAKGEWSEQQLLEIFHAALNHPKAPKELKGLVVRLKAELHKARKVSHHACVAPERPKNGNFSQVKQVPVGAVATGGGPA